MSFRTSIATKYIYERGYKILVYRVVCVGIYCDRGRWGEMRESGLVGVCMREWGVGNGDARKVE